MTWPHEHKPMTQEELREEYRELLQETLHVLNQQNRFRIEPRKKGDCTESYQLAHKIETFLDKTKDGRPVYRNPLLTAPYGEDQQ